MHPIRIVSAICSSIFLTLSAFAESHEGFLGDIPIWMDLALPAQDGPLKGSYFYKKVGTPIALEGEKAGAKLSLREKDGKGKVTGAFALVWKGKDLAGDWGKPGAKKRLEVRLPLTDPAYKQHAVHRFSDLKLLEEGNLAATIAELGGEGSDGPPEIGFLYDQRNILSVEVSSCGTGAYTTCTTNRYLFDLTRKKQVSLWDEIDAAGLKRLWKILGPKLDAELKEQRAGFSDSEWVDVLGERIDPEAEDPVKVLDGIFSASHSKPAPGVFDGCYLDSASVHFASDRPWFGFPHVIQDHDVTVHITMPIGEFAQYVKPGSFLRNLVKQP